MAKTYSFTLKLQEAQPSTGGNFAVVFGGSDSVYASQHVECTLAEVVGKLRELSQQEPRLHAGCISMASRRDRKPPKFDDVTYGFLVASTVDGKYTLHRDIGRK